MWKNIFILSSGKIIEYRDISFGEYLDFIHNEGLQEAILKKILVNIKLEEIGGDLEKFILEIFENILGEKPKTTKKKEENSEDLIFGYMMHYLHQSYSEILKMPARLVFSLLSKLPEITGNKTEEMERSELKNLF